MLPGHEPIVTAQLAKLQSHTRLFFHAMAWIEVLLSIIGIIALWLMRSFASILYAAKIVTSIINALIGIFVLHIVQLERQILTNSSRALSHPTIPGWAALALPIVTIVFMIGFQVSLFLYVWRVTYLLPRHSESKPTYV
jgi:hypothetical protein